MVGRELVAAHFDNTLSKAQAEALAAWIAESPENAQFFAEWSVLEDQISERYGVAELLSAEKHVSALAVSDIRGRGLAQRWSLRLGLLAAAAVVLITGAVILLTRAQLSPGITPMAQNPVPDTRTQDIGQRVVATVSGQRGAVWADSTTGESKSLQPGAPILAGPNRLAQGVAHLRTVDGVDLLIEGPADFIFEDMNTIRLESGRIYGDSAGSSEQFHITSDRVDMTDCNQAFAMHIDTDASALCQVYSGTADVLARDTAGETAYVSRLMPNQSLTLTAEGQVHVGRLDDAAFVRTIEASALEVGRDYVEAVRASGPTDYWRFEQLEDGNLYNDIPGRPGLRIQSVGDGLEITQDMQNRHLHRTARTGEYLVSTEKLSVNSDRYSIECWVRNARPDRWSTLFAFQVFPEPWAEHEFGLIQLEMLPADDGNLAAGHRFMLTHANRAGRFEPDLYTQPDPHASEWQHIVLVRDGLRIALYRNGEAWFSGEARSAGESMKAVLVIGRNGITPGGEFRLFDGSLDEVALYDRPLTAQEIRNHYQSMDRLPNDNKGGLQ